MERTYPYMTRNLVRPDMSPVLVPDEAYDRALCDEWWNPYGVPRAGSAPPVSEPEPAPIKRGPGRPPKGAK